MAYNGIDTSHLLPNHEEDTDNSTLPITWHQPHLLEQSLSAGFTNKSPLVLKLLSHLLDFVLDIAMVRGKTVS
jgi:hypothetical protein